MRRWLQSFTGFISASMKTAEKAPEGLWRAIATFFICLTTLGWLFVVIGFNIGKQKVKDVKNEAAFPTLFAFEGSLNDGEKLSSYPLWIASLTGIAVIATSLAHEALKKPYSKIMGVLVSTILIASVKLLWIKAGFLSVLFVSSLGMIVYVTGSLIHNINNDNYDSDLDIPDWYALEFGGAILALLFWTPVMMLWPLYDTKL